MNKITLTLTFLLILVGVGFSQDRPRIIKTVESTAVASKTFVASAYCLKGPRMANGERPHNGAVAADTRVLPIGSKITILGMGNYVVKDTGGAIRGNRLDVYMPSCRNAILFGKRKVQVIKNSGQVPITTLPL